MPKTRREIASEVDEVLRSGSHGKEHPPNATILLQRRGRYVDDDTVMVGTAVGDIADSHSAVYRALRRANIEPIYLGVGSFKVTFDPNEIDGEVAVAVVQDALHSAGIRVHRIDLRNGK